MDFVGVDEFAEWLPSRKVRIKLLAPWHAMAEDSRGGTSNRVPVRPPTPQSPFSPKKLATGFRLKLAISSYPAAL